MFFLQQQLSEKRCGHWTEVPAHLFNSAAVGFSEPEPNKIKSD